ncbi:MAG: hypothetical protein HY580_08010 [Nitrospinae bacterium]|nr:hypothetical protein [Nitrospinota bacterium]
MKFAGYILSLILFLVLPAYSLAEDGSSPKSLNELERRIKVLEEKNAAQKSEPAPSPVTPALPSSATGISRVFNPAFSVNGLFLGTYRSEKNKDQSAEVKTGLNVQELELQATAYIDTYLRGDIVLSLPTAESIEIEEAIVDFVPMRNLSARAGKFLTPFGKHNQLHTHQFPFIDAPLVSAELFGEGLNEKGAGLNWIAPAPWYSEINLQLLEGENANALNSRFNDDFGYLLHNKNLWDVNEDTTMELGGSYLYGKNNAETHNVTHAAGGNLTVKWKPVRRSIYNTLIWQTEYLAAFKENGVDPDTNVKLYDDKGGVYTSLQYQFARRWWVQGRYDYFGLHTADDANDKQRWSALLAFAPSEFSAVRLQYNHLDYANRATLGLTDEHQVLLQLNFTMGSHPAHKY